MDIQVGQYVYRNTDGTIEIEGALQMEIFLRSSGAHPQLTFAIFNKAGKMTAKLQNSHFSINEGSAYSLTKTTTFLLIKHSESGTEVLNLSVESQNKIVISKGNFYTLKGHIINITPKEWTIEKTTVTEGETDMKGKAASLG